MLAGPRVWRRAVAQTVHFVDITLVQASVLHLPTAQRAGAIVYDGTTDLQLWRPPGPDRELLEACGDGLQDALDKERERVGELDPGMAVRLPPGKLHCDFIIWVAGRPPHGDERASAAPDVAAIERLAQAALEFASARGVARVAFSGLGAGRGAAEPQERVAAVVRAANRFKEACFNAGRPAGIEEVVVCDPSAATLAKAKRLVSRLARSAAVPDKPQPRASRTTTSMRRPRVAKPPPGLDPDEVARARSFAERYDRTREYGVGDWLQHPTFGIGRVEEVDVDRRIRIKFENGDEKTLIHAR